MAETGEGRPTKIKEKDKKKDEGGKEANNMNKERTTKRVAPSEGGEGGEGQSVPARSGEVQDVRLVEVTDEAAKELVKEFEPLFGEQTKEIVEALGAHTERVVESLGVQTEEVLNALGIEGTVEFVGEGVEKRISEFKAERSDFRRSLEKSRNSLEESLKEESLTEREERTIINAVEKVEKAVESLRGELATQTEQVPEHLRIPTPERMLQLKILEEQTKLQMKELGEEEALKRLKELDYGQDPYRSEAYQKDVEEWFEERLREMETAEESFTEQGELSARVDLALSFFKFRPETKALAEKLNKRMEARKIKKAMVRSWNLYTPEDLMGIAGRVSPETFKEVFTYQDAEGTPVADEFRKYEEMAEDLDGTNDKKVEKEIENYFKHGGELDLEKENAGIIETAWASLEEEDRPDKPEFVDDAIQVLERKEARVELKPQEKKLLRELKDKLWARRSAGELWSVTFRAAHFGVQLNGTGDFFAGRIMNFTDQIKDKPGYNKLKVFLENDELGKFDIGLRDFFSDMMPTRLSPEDRGAGRKLWSEKEGADIDGDGERILSLAGVKNLGREEFWDELFEEGKVNESAYTTQVSNFRKADKTREKLWGLEGGFLQNPNRRNFRELSNEFRHISDQKSPKTEKVKAEYGDEDAVMRQEKLAEVVDRFMIWTEEDEAEEKIEDLKYARSAIKMIFMGDAENLEMITNKQRDTLLRKHISLPIPFRSAVANARTRARLSNLASLWRDEDSRALLIQGNFAEFFKKAWGYIFSDEIRR